jgi:thiamine biosynthesis lipoprotein
MGLPISVLARGSEAHSAAAERAVAAVFAELVEVDRVFSPYRPDSDVSRLAARALTLAGCAPVVGEVAARSEQARALTGGLFDATRPDGTWDPSGLVKGWATERAFAHLSGVAGLDWCLNAGGDVVVDCPSARPFTVGIQDPRDAAGVAATVQCVSGGVATSGTAARGAHLYDPRTGTATRSAWLSVTVAGPSLETADVLATAAYVAGDAWRDVVALVPGYEGLGIDGDGTTMTAGWPQA